MGRESVHCGEPRLHLAGLQPVRTPTEDAARRACLLVSVLLACAGSRLERRAQYPGSWTVSRGAARRRAVALGSRGALAAAEQSLQFRYRSEEHTSELQSRGH